MLKQLLTKTLLVAVGLCTGVSAWADNVYTILYGTPIYDTDGVTVKGVSAQTDFTSTDGSTASDVTSSDANGSNCTNAMPIGGSVLYSNPSFSKSFENAATKGTVHFEANYTATTNGQETWKIVDSKGVEIFGTTDCGYSNGNATKNWGFCNGVSLGTNWFRQARGGHNRVVLDINLTSKVVSYTVLVSSGNNSYSTLTGTYNLPEGVDDVKGLTATKQSYFSYMDNVSFYNVYDNAVSEAAYTINYQLSGTTVASETGSGSVGATVNAQTSIWNAGKTQKYYVVSGETTTFTIANGTNTFNVAVREAENWTYSVKALVGGEELLTIATPSVVEGENASYGYPQYVAKDGVLYKSNAQNSNPWWGKSFTPAANNEVQTLTYTAEGTTDIVYCSEAEDISDITVVSGGNTDIRASNRKGGYGSNVMVTTLSAGIYKIYTAAYGNSSNGSTVFTYKAGDVTVMELATEGNPRHHSSDVFAIFEETAITVSGGNGGNSPKVVDYIIIQRMGDIPATVSKSISAAGWATYCSPYALDFSNVEGLTAYIVKGANANGVLDKEEVTTIPANTGVMLKGAKGSSYNIPVVASAEAVTENKMVGVTAETQLDPKSGWVLMNDATNGLGFYCNENTFTVGANTAYIPVDEDDFKNPPTEGAKTRFFSLDGEDATAINGIKGEKNADNAAIYNLAGQRVNGGYKGIVIKNGKKVFVK